MLRRINAKLLSLTQTAHGKKYVKIISVESYVFVCCNTSKAQDIIAIDATLENTDQMSLN